MITKKHWPWDWDEVSEEAIGEGLELREFLLSSVDPSIKIYCALSTKYFSISILRAFACNCMLQLLRIESSTDKRLISVIERLSELSFADSREGLDTIIASVHPWDFVGRKFVAGIIFNFAKNLFNDTPRSVAMSASFQAALAASRCSFEPVSGDTRSARVALKIVKDTLELFGTGWQNFAVPEMERQCLVLAGWCA